jgi:acetyl esterase/lipase
MNAVVSTTNTALPLAHDILESNLTIPMRDNHLSTFKTRKPASPPPTGSPLIVIAPGGGWIAGNLHQMAQESRALVRLFGAVVVNISYRLAPELKFPIGQYDTWDSLVWLAAHAREIGADPSQGFIVGGTSAGAASAAVCARQAQIEPLSFPLTGQWLNVPSLMEARQVPEKWMHLYLSLQHNKDAHVLPVSDLEIMAKQTGWDFASPWRSPLSSEHPLAGLPKTYFQVDGMDCLRDDGLLYDEMLKEAGVETSCDFYAGCPHAHATFLPGTEVGKKALLDLVRGFGWMVGREVGEDEAFEALDLL